MKDSRMEIAKQIVEFSDQVLSTKKSQDYIALQLGTGRKRNAVTVSNSDHVGFFIQSSGLLKKAKEEGFDPKEEEFSKHGNKHKFVFSDLTLEQIQAHEGLFRDIVRESVDTIKEWKGNGRKR